MIHLSKPIQKANYVSATAFYINHFSPIWKTVGNNRQWTKIEINVVKFCWCRHNFIRVFECVAALRSPAAPPNASLQTTTRWPRSRFLAPHYCTLLDLTWLDLIWLPDDLTWVQIRNASHTLRACGSKLAYTAVTVTLPPTALLRWSNWWYTLVLRSERIVGYIPVAVPVHHDNSNSPRIPWNSRVCVFMRT